MNKHSPSQELRGGCWQRRCVGGALMRLISAVDELVVGKGGESSTEVGQTCTHAKTKTNKSTETACLED